MKNQSIFFALKISNMCPELMKNWRAWKIESIQAQKLTKSCLLAHFFQWKWVIFCPFLPLSALKLRQLIFSCSCAGLVGIGGWTHVLRGGTHWFHPRNSTRKREMAKTPPRVKKHKTVKNSVTKPPIKIPRPLFTLQLLILHEMNPFHTPKCLN